MTTARRLVLAAMLTTFFPHAGPLAQERPGPSVGDPAPPIAIAAIEGETGATPPTLATLHGRPVLLEFWATWCQPCLASVPHINALAREFGDEVAFLSITSEEPDKVRPVLARHRFGTRVAYDAGGATHEAYGVRALPRTVLIDKEGRIAAITRPSVVTKEILRALVDGKPISVPHDVDIAAVLDGGDPVDAEALGRVSIAASRATSGSSRAREGSGRIDADGVTLEILIQLAWNLHPRLIDASAIADETHPVFRTSVAAADDAAARRLLRGAILAVFDLEERLERREIDAAVLRRIDGGAPPPPAAPDATGQGVIRIREAKRDKIRMPHLADRLASYVFDRPGIDETGLDGFYAVDMEWTPGDRASFDAALVRHGLRFTLEKRPADVVVLTRSAARR